MNTHVYIDAFNLYYGALRSTPYKWLDVKAMCQKILPRNQILKIHYCTARVSARPNDPGQPQRQQLYLRALKTIPELEITYGHFLTQRVRMLRTRPPAGGQSSYVEVFKTEEKGSDVNIASLLLADGFNNRFDVAVIVSNDSDLALPVQIVRNELQKPVGMINPHRNPSHTLRTSCSFYRSIRQGVLRSSQFPATLQDANGTFSKPPSW